MIFLWDQSFMSQSFGIFVENPRNTTIQGNEFLAKPESRTGMTNTNRIGKDKILNKWVRIIKGRFKG